MGYLALWAAMALVFAIYVPHQQEKEAGRAFERHATSLTRVLANLAQASVVVEDMGGAETLEQDFKTAGRSDSEVLYLRALRPDGSVIAGYQSTEGETKVESITATETAASLIRDGVLHTSEPIIHEDEYIGSIVAGFSRSNVTDRTAKTRRDALYMDLAMLIIGILLMLLVVRSVTKPVMGVAGSLDKVSKELSDAARAQAASSAEEAAVVAQTRQSMETLLNSAQEIANQSSEVLGNAERSAIGSQQVADRFADLAQMIDKVAEILATIMNIADRADLLALNASLEGTRAGEAGKGFTLVAGEMRRLAENIMGSVSVIRTLMNDMRGASLGAVEASDKGQQSSQETMASARRIAMLTQEQRQATEQVMTSMDEMNVVLRQAFEGVQRATSVSEGLVDLSTALAVIVSAEHTNPHKSSGSDDDEADEDSHT